MQVDRFLLSPFGLEAVRAPVYVLIAGILELVPEIVLKKAVEARKRERDKRGGYERERRALKAGGELELIHYYLQKGFDWDRLSALSSSEKLFLRASMELELDREAEKYKALFGKR